MFTRTPLPLTSAMSSAAQATSRLVESTVPSTTSPLEHVYQAVQGSQQRREQELQTALGMMASVARSSAQTQSDTSFQFITPTRTREAEERAAMISRLESECVPLVDEAVSHG